MSPAPLGIPAATAASINIPGTNINVPTPGEAASTVANAINPFGQTSQKLFSALQGPVLEVAVTVVLAGMATALLVWALIQIAKPSVESAGSTVEKAAPLAAAL